MRDCRNIGLRSVLRVMVVRSMIIAAAAIAVVLGASLGTAQDSLAPAASANVTVTMAGTGAGTVTSSPAGISCKPTCSAAFAAGTSVKLTPVAAKGSYFAGWSGACKEQRPARLR